MRNDKISNPILEKSFKFSLGIIEFSEELVSLKKFRMADQIFRSGTSIGANIRESQNAESRNDFIHKLKVAAKEADETAYWLELCNSSPYYPGNDLLYSELSEINKILSKIIGTLKRNGNS
jgi:four helix bundle protein